MNVVISDDLNKWIGRLAGDLAAASDSTTNSDDDTPYVKPTLLLTVSRCAMACEFEVLFNQHQYSSAADLGVQALDLIQGIEEVLSVYKPRSDLSNLNRFGAERSVGISYDAATLLELAKFLHVWTKGAFDVTAGSLSSTWGFSKRAARKPNETEIRRALEAVGTHYLEVDSTDNTARMLRKGVQANPGGIGKGYALDCAARRLVSHGIRDFMIHGGMSSVAARGDRQHPQTGGGWLVSLKHPWRWEEHLGTIRLRDQALGTSGSGKQFFHFGGKRYSHIIDPRTGWPAQGMMSATVLCRSCAIADALATALFVMGPETSIDFCNEHQLSAILVHQNDQGGRQQITTCGVDESIWTPAR